MQWRGAPLVVAAALLAAGLGLAASLAWSGDSERLARTPLGRWLLPFGNADSPPFRTSQVAPFSLPDRRGQPMTLPRPGRRLLINYWASWCEPCRREMPLLADYARGQGNSGVEVVGIALDEARDAERFLVVTPVCFPILLETAVPADSSARLGNSRSVLPYSVLIDAQGRLRGRHFGPFASRGELEAWVAASR